MMLFDGLKIYGVDVFERGREASSEARVRILRAVINRKCDACRGSEERFHTSSSVLPAHSPCAQEHRKLAVRVMTRRNAGLVRIIGV